MGASSSGQTVFVEPLETIEQNNELVRLLDEEHGRGPSDSSRDDPADRRERGCDCWRRPKCWRELELQFAKARFAEDYNCVAVTLSRSAGVLAGIGDGVSPSLRNWRQS